MARRSAPGLDYTYEVGRQAQHGPRIAGIDEAGRGPWAGPVVAAAVILDPANMPEGLNDSKVVNQTRRKELAAAIVASAHVGVGIADVARIDRDNILQATLWAMQQACRQLGVPPDLALIDGNRPPRLNCPVETVVAGDALVASIAAASIIAKVTRDALMRVLALDFPQYGFEQHKGYGTAAHRTALDAHGPCSAHRRSFRPIATLIAAQKAR